MRSFITALFAKYKQNGHVKEDEMGSAFSKNGEKRNACSLFMGK
jgi:hypothetical protein